MNCKYCSALCWHPNKGFYCTVPNCNPETRPDDVREICEKAFGLHEQKKKPLKQECELMNEHCRGCIRYLKSCCGMSKAVCEKYKLRIPRTNADRIRAMDDEELADFMTDDFCELLCKSPTVCDWQCNLKLLQWLKQEAE